VIVNTGLIQKLTQELTYFSGFYWGLFTNNVTITATTALSALTEATWAGYAEVTGLTWSTPTIVGGAALSTGSPNPSFSNTSGSAQSFYGWFCKDSAGNLVAAVNLGAQSLPNAGTYVITPTTNLAEA
jgi:hypothetical protein